MNRPKQKLKKGTKQKKVKKKYNITYEILPPATLKRNPACFTQTPADRWEEIIDICAEIIAESELD
ncbi:hypothetical protein KKG29_05280 [Patescibacteria group bacterium]|nr:hypothetical protein [Patescibacteria group bacterium]MBU4057300.1 hypothetical protein [Patescibacteria group bacterium]